MTALLTLYARDAEATMMILIAAFFLSVYVGVPTILLRNEPAVRRRVGFSEFLERGVETWCGHVCGREALVQILIVPTLVTMGVIIIGIMARCML